LAWAICCVLGIALLTVFAFLALGDLQGGDPEASGEFAWLQDCARRLVFLCVLKNDAIAGALASTCEPAFAVDCQGEIVAWNAAAQECFGYDAKEALGRQCWDLLAGKDVFENRYCCAGCPIRAAAFSHEAIRHNQLRLRTASRRRQRFDVCMLLVPDGHDAEVLVHLCRPVREARDGTTDGQRDRPGPADASRGGLTEKEIKVLALLSRGLETGELASQLCVSEATVRNHIQHILAKLRVHGRVAAVARGRQLGVI